MLGEVGFVDGTVRVEEDADAEAGEGVDEEGFEGAEEREKELKILEEREGWRCRAGFVGELGLDGGGVGERPSSDREEEGIGVTRVLSSSSCSSRSGGDSVGAWNVSSASS